MKANEIKNISCKQIKLGCQDGNSFIWIGEPKEFDDNFFDWMNHAILETRQRLIDTNIKNNALLVNRISAFSKALEDWGDATFFTDRATGKRMSKEATKQKKQHLESELEFGQKSLERKRDSLKNYIPLAERDVIEKYYSTYLPDTVICIIAGDDDGKYWFAEEIKK